MTSQIRSQTCRKCSKANHFTSVSASPPASDNRCAKWRENCWRWGNGDSVRAYCNLNVNGRSVRLMLDDGSTVYERPYIPMRRQSTVEMLQWFLSSAVPQPRRQRRQQRLQTVHGTGTSRRLASPMMLALGFVFQLGYTLDSTYMYSRIHTIISYGSPS